MNKGFVYILKNVSMPGLVKIGRTTRSVQQRCHELYVTGVPTPFEVVDEAYSPDCHSLEHLMHAQFNNMRVSESREFFALDPLVASGALQGHLREQVSGLVDEFLPDHVVVEDYLSISEDDIHRLCREMSAHFIEVLSALEAVTPEELRPALERHRKGVAERLRRHAEAGQ